MIHPTAVIHPRAEIDPTVTVGPYTIIDEAVRVGPRCVIGPHVHLTGHTTIGSENQFHTGCVIGDAPQDLKYRNELTRLRIGDRNVFREHFTVHRSNKVEEETIIGSNNFLMAHAHIGHNCSIGDNVVIVNGALLAGHVVVQDRAFISGTCMLHQFVRVGTLAMMQGGAGIGKDLPPFCIARGNNGICGLNVVGLRRAGFTSEQRLQLKRLYHLLFRRERRFSELLAEARSRFTEAPASVLIEFVAASKRGVCSDTGARYGEDAE